MQNVQVRVAPSIGDLEGTHHNVWKTKDYTSVFEPCVFFGVYGLPDFYTLNRHQGKRYVLWAGTDITHFLNGYWLDKKGKYKLDVYSLASWINDNCENWVENVVEQYALASVGIKAKVCPSFMGDKNAIKLSYKWRERPQVYASVSGDNFLQYGWDVISKVAKKVLEVDFHLYGNKKRWPRAKNVIVHGRVNKEQMNKEIADMQCGLRPLGFDGFSEVLAKSVLMGQWPISLIPYPLITNYKDEADLIKKLKNLKSLKKPNLKARSFYLKALNRYSWNYLK